jgi:hypothetical protein
MQLGHYYLWDKDDGIQIQRTKSWYKIGTTRTIGLKIRSSQSNSFKKKGIWKIRNKEKRTKIVLE